GGGDLAALDGDAGVLVGVLPALRREHVLLVGVRAARVEVAVLEHDGGVAEDEVHRAVDVAVAVELAKRVRVQRVLVAREAAPVERRQVGVHPQRHRLVLARPRRVLHRYVPRQKPPKGLVTERGRAEGCGVVDDVAAGLDDGLPRAVADEHDVGLLAPDLHVLEVPAGLDVYHVPRLAVVRRRRHRLAHRRELPAPVLRHHHVRRHLLLQPPPVRRRHPRREPASHAAVPFQWLLLRPAPPLGREAPHHGERVGDQVGDVVDAALDERPDAPVLRGGRPGEPVEAGVLVRHRRRQHGLHAGGGLLGGAVPGGELRGRRAQQVQR
ncbi:hypothetical protein EE612_041350, partial [Oryza sativa]